MALLLIGITLAVFWPVHGHEFVLWDDQVNVYENPYLHPVTPSNILRFWKEPYENLYIPLTYSIWAAIAYFAKRPVAEEGELTLDPTVFHVTNLVFHLLSVIVVFAILRILVGNDWAGCVGAMLFALHPVQVEPVAWITGTKDVLSGLLSLIAVWQYLSYVGNRIEGNRQGTRKNCFFATVALVLALLAKPTAVIVPIVAWVVVDLEISLKNYRSESRNIHLLPVSWVIVAVSFIVLTTSVQDTAVTFNTPLWARPLVAGDAACFYFYKLFLPIRFGIDYGRSPEFVLQQNWIFLTGLLPYGLAALVWRMRHSRPWLAAAAGLFVIGVLPVSGLIPFAFQKHSTVADRYLYLSMLGPAFALAWLVSLLRSRMRGRVIAVVCLSILGWLGIHSSAQVRYWAGNIKLFQHALEVNPYSSMSHNNLGLALMNQGEIKDGIAHFQKAVCIKPEYPHALNNLGSALMRQGKTKEAISHYRKALLIKPDYAKAHNNLAIALAQQDNIADSIAHFRKALLIKPDFAGAHYNLANALKQEGKTQEAIAHFRKALLIKPDFAGAHYNLANALKQEGKTQEAIIHFQKALRTKPNDPDIHNNIGIALARLGKIQEAIAHFRKALQIKPDFEEAEANLSIAITKQQQSL